VKQLVDGISMKSKHAFLLENKGVGRRFSGGRGGQWKNQDREIAPISLHPFSQWLVRRCQGMHPGFISGEHCIKSTA